MNAVNFISMNAVNFINLLARPNENLGIRNSATPTYSEEVNLQGIRNINK